MINKKGFTLLELIIVMAIIAILIGMVVASFSGFKAEANKTRAMKEIRVLQLALEAFYKNNNYYPEPKPAQGDWQDILVEQVPQILPSKLYDPFNSGSLYCYALSSGDRSVSRINNSFAGDIFCSPAYAAAAGGGSPPTPPPPDTPSYQTAQYYIIWSIGIDGDVTQVCSVSESGSVEANDKAVWVSNGNVQ